MSVIGKWLNDRQWNKHYRNTRIYGTGAYLSCNRKRFNPLRYLLGELKVKAVEPHEFYIVKKES